MTRLGKIILGLASMLLIAFVSLFVFGSYLATWPIMRLSPRDQRLRTLMNLATAILSTVQVWSDSLIDRDS
jgi:uncharacterized membrane protein